MAKRRWHGPVVKVTNPKFVENSDEHIAYKEQQKRYYQQTLSRQRDRARERVARKRERNQQWIVNYLQGKVCIDCGESKVTTLSFDHRSDTEKYSNIGDLVSRGASLEKLSNEVDKCDIRCHNCHMEKTFGPDYYRQTMSPCSEEEFNKKYEGFTQ